MHMLEQIATWLELCGVEMMLHSWSMYGVTGMKFAAPADTRLDVKSQSH